MKENDYFLNQLYNPEFSPGDFQSIGLNSGNTTIRNKEDYNLINYMNNHYQDIIYFQIQTIMKDQQPAILLLEMIFLLNQQLEKIRQKL